MSVCFFRQITFLTAQRFTHVGFFLILLLLLLLRRLISFFPASSPTCMEALA